MSAAPASIAPAAAFTPYPAIDVREGAVVRLAQGDFARQTRYGDTPLALAIAYARAGASWLHLVDLDAAREGRYTLAPLLREIKTATGLRVQTGGGVRGEADVEHLLDAGADRVVVGSLAVTQPESIAGWLARFGADHVVIALDARQSEHGDWRPATHGWTRESDCELIPLVQRHRDAGLRHLLCTDIGRDGMLSGPNMGLYALLREQAPQLLLQASGGARNVDDVRAARAAGCAGIVLGRALLEGKLTLEDALQC